MTVFDAALGTLLTDPNLAVAAEWQAAAGGAWVALRLAPAAPQDPTEPTLLNRCRHSTP